MKKASFIILIAVEILCAAFSLGQIYFWLERGNGFFIGLIVYLAALLFLVAREMRQKAEGDDVSRKVTLLAMALLLLFPTLILIAISSMLFVTFGAA